MTSLALKYRPKQFTELIGQKINAVVLDRMVTRGEVPTGLLFSGPKGSGKTSTARILASSLSADPIEMDAASHGLVADVRELIENLRFSTGDTFRVVVLDECHSLTREAFNTLLKTLEEPPAGTIFILVTTEPDKVPETVKSRLMEFTFRKVSTVDIKKRLLLVCEKENISAESELIDYLSDRADGSVRDGLMMLDQCWKAGVSDKKSFMEMSGEEDLAPDLIIAMLTGKYDYVFQVADDLSQRVPDPMKLAAVLVSTLKEILILKNSGAPIQRNEKIEKLLSVLAYLEPERIVASLKMIWDLRTRLRQSSDPRGNLDLVLVLVTDIFTQGRGGIQVGVRKEPQKSPESRKLTLSEL